MEIEIQASSHLSTPQNPSQTLSQEQENVRRLVLQGKSCFLTGCGGTGKSFLTLKLISDLKDLYGPSLVGVTATTGIAACHIRGVSLHSFAGIGLGQESVEQLIPKIRKNKPAHHRWKTCKCLVIDEISMLDSALFDKLDMIARKLRENDRPFGGLQLLLVGDFAQLPPVSKGDQSVGFCFEAKGWDQAIQVQAELRHVFRQSNTEFVQLLNCIREGVCTPAMTARLNSTRNNSFNESSGVLTTRLFARNVDVEAINLKAVSELTGNLMNFQAQDVGQSPFREALEKSCIAPKTLLLKVGAQVMLLKNIDIATGLTNGARGVVVEMVEEDNENGGVWSENGGVWSLGKTKVLLWVRFETSGGTLVYGIRQEIFSMEVAGEVVASRMQFPLRLAYAITIHKCQGMTLPRAELSLQDVFECGQAYVALSRVQDLGGLRLLDFSPSVVRAHPRVVEFYRRMRAQTGTPSTLPDDMLSDNLPSDNLPPDNLPPDDLRTAKTSPTSSPQRSQAGRSAKRSIEQISQEEISQDQITPACCLACSGPVQRGNLCRACIAGRREARRTPVKHAAHL